MVAEAKEQEVDWTQGREDLAFETNRLEDHTDYE